MLRTRKILLILSLASAGACAMAQSPRESDAPREGEAPRGGAHILVVPRAGLALEALDEILARHGARRVDAIRAINVQIVEVKPGTDAHALAKRLAQLPEIANAEVDERVPPAARPSSR
jgi:hypothetical protein